MDGRKAGRKELNRHFQTTCGWCGGDLASCHEVLGGGIKAKPGVDLRAIEGQVIKLAVQPGGMQISLAVVTADSDAKKQGYDLVYMVCFEECARALQLAFRASVDEVKPGDTV